ncbi:Exocyst complex component sec6, partial [Dictyocoela roeselum]
EWVQAIVDSEIEKFYSRETAPDEDENKKYISPGFINLLQIIKEQLEPISFDKTIFKLVTTKIIILAENFRGQINGAMENDLKKSYQLKSKPGYEEYAIMFGNSGLKLAQYANSLPECQNIEVKALGNIFIDVLKKSNQCLTIFVLKTCQPITDQIFTDSWYFEELHNHNENYSADGHNSYTTNTNPDGHNSYTTNTNPNNYANGNSHNNTPARTTLSKRFAVTIEDFLSDYFISMSEYSFVTFLYELASEIVGVYVRQLSRRRAKIRTNCRNCLLRDFRLLKMVFKKYGDDEIANNLNLIHRIGPIVEASSLDLFLTELRIFRADFPDLKKDFAKNLVKKRIDLEEGEKRVWIDGIKKVFED